MLEIIFGSRDTFVTVVAVTFGLIVLTPLIVAILSASITGFVTRGEKTKAYLYEYTVVRSLCGNSPDLGDWIAGSLMHIFLSLGAAAFGGTVGLVIWHTPVWVYILTAVIAGVLLTARFAYTLKSKFDKHLEKLHENADKDDYDVKW